MSSNKFGKSILGVAVTMLIVGCASPYKTLSSFSKKNIVKTNDGEIFIFSQQSGYYTMIGAVDAKLEGLTYAFHAASKIAKEKGYSNIEVI